MAISLKVLRDARRKRRYTKTLFALPYLFTFGNALCGFLAVTNALEGNITTAALFILCAAFMDGIDGRLARYLGVTSNLGMELDSLCDAVSFCFAPMVVLYSFYKQPHSLFIGALVFVLCAGLFRLARFNTISVDNKDDFFKGLPTTMVAIFIASFMYYRDMIQASVFSFMLHELWCAGILLILAWLMISSVRFPSFKKNSMQAYVFRFLLSAMAIMFFASFFYNIPVLFITALMYVVSGPALAVISYARARRVLNLPVISQLKN